MATDMTMKTTEQKRANVRLGLILASVAFAFFMGFLLNMRFFG